MLLRRFTDFVLQNRLHAMGVAFAFSLMPLLGASLGILVATLVTLRKGAFEGTLVLGATIAPFLLSYALSSPSSQSQMMMIATVTIVAINIVTWLLALVLRRYGNWSFVIEVAILTGVVLISVIHLVFPDIQDWWSLQLAAYLKKTAPLFQQLAPEGAPSEEMMEASVIAGIKPYITGFVMASIIFNALLQLVIARGWQAVIFNPGGLRKELYQIRLGYVSAAVFVIVLALAYTSNVFGLDMMPVMVTAFCVAGLSLIHYVLAPRQMGWFWLVLVYLGVMFIFPMGIVLVAIAGLLDSFFNLRLRFER